MGHHWWHLWFYEIFCPHFKFLSSPNLTSVHVSISSVRTSHRCPWSPTYTNVRGNLDAERWHNVQDKLRRKKKKELFHGQALLICESLTQPRLGKSWPQLGKEGEQIPELVSWRGQWWDHRESQEPDRQCLGPVPSEAAGGHRSCLSCSGHCTALHRTPTGGYGSPSTDSSSSISRLCGHQLKHSKPFQKQILKEERGCGKTRHPTTYRMTTVCRRRHRIKPYLSLWHAI